jgi:hypothetical protein
MRVLSFLLGLSLSASVNSNTNTGTAAPVETKMPVIFSGGYETDGRDRGRPVILVASALNVPPDVFRKAFSGVHPAHGDGGPTDHQARDNKAALMSVLGPYGVTDERLNEVSNRYRYRREQGEMWPNKDATAYAMVRDETVTGFVVTDGGYGYSSPPTVTVEGLPAAKATAKLMFSTDFNKNGSVVTVDLAK